MTLSDFHPISTSTQGTRDTHTGRWGVIKPFAQEKISPCRLKCPGGIHIPGFMNQIQEEDLAGAWRTICEENPLPRVTGRVCPHPCEADCLRGMLDEKMAIRPLERFVGDWAHGQGLSPYEGDTLPSDIRAAVIGSGPAGISCAYHLLKRGYDVSLFEARPELGGLLRYGIPEFKLPRRVLAEALETILADKARVHLGVTVGRDISWEEIRKDFQAVFLGLGAQRATRLDLGGQDAGDVLDGLTFLKTAADRSPVKPGQKVLILGGGNTACDVARVVLRQGGQPHILYRRSENDMPAFQEEIADCREEGIDVRALTMPAAIQREDGRLKGLTCLKTSLAETDADGRRNFQPMPNSEHFIDGSLIVTAFGHFSEERLLPIDVRVTDGAVAVTDQGACNARGVFAGGDLTPATRTVIHAIASGKRVALGLNAYFRNQESLPPAPAEPPEVVQPEQINLHYYSRAPRETVARRPAEERVLDSQEIEGTMSSEAAAREASRCFRCGYCNACGNCAFFCPDMAVHFDFQRNRVVVDKDYCKGCCICVEECPRGVMSMEEIE